MTRSTSIADAYGSSGLPAFLLRSKSDNARTDKWPSSAMSSEVSHLAWMSARPRSLHKNSSSPELAAAVPLRGEIGPSASMTFGRTSMMRSIELSSAANAAAFAAFSSAFSASFAAFAAAFSAAACRAASSSGVSGAFLPLPWPALWMHGCLRVPGPPNFGLSRQFLHTPQSSMPSLVPPGPSLAGDFDCFAAFLPYDDEAGSCIGQSQSPSGTVSSAGVRHFW